MNTARPDPDVPLPNADGVVLHSSARTRMSTNLDSVLGGRSRIAIATTRLEMRVVDGDLVMHFTAHRADDLPARPAANRQQYRRRR
jgi:hypothetical protein